MNRLFKPIFLSLAAFVFMAYALISCENSGNPLGVGTTGPKANQKTGKTDLLVSAQNKSKPGEADIDFDSRTVDLGEVEPSGKKEVLINVHNRGPKPLTISKIKSSCGCTAVWLADQGKPILKGQSRQLKIKLEARAGKQIPSRSRITFFSNDPAEPTAFIDTKVKIKKYVTVTPAALNFGQLLKGEEKEVRVFLASLDNKPVDIQQIICRDPNVKFIKGAPERDRQGHPGIPITVKFSTGNKPLGNFRNIIQINLNHEKQKNLFINTYGIIGGEVLLKNGARILNIPLFDAGVLTTIPGPIVLPDSRKLKVALHEKSSRNDLKVLQVISEPGPISLEPVKTTDPKELELSIVNNAKYRTGFFRQKFKVMLNHPEMPICIVYIQGTVQSSLKLNNEGFYVETPPNQAFEQKIGITKFRKVATKKPPKLEIVGGKFCEYKLVPGVAGEIQLVLSSEGLPESILEEIEVKDIETGEIIPITVWVEVLK